MLAKSPERIRTQITEALLDQTKNTPNLRVFYPRKSYLVRSVDKRWNRLYPDIIRLVQGLERLGLEYHDGKVSYVELAGDSNV